MAESRSREQSSPLYSALCQPKSTACVRPNAGHRAWDGVGAGRGGLFERVNVDRCDGLTPPASVLEYGKNTDTGLGGASPPRCFPHANAVGLSESIITAAKLSFTTIRPYRRVESAMEFRLPNNTAHEGDTSAIRLPEGFAFYTEHDFDVRSPMPLAIAGTATHVIIGTSGNGPLISAARLFTAP